MGYKRGLSNPSCVPSPCPGVIPLDNVAIHRPRNVDWKRAAALLYGDWGTSKAYVIGLAFVAAKFASLPIILAVCALTAVVAYNYVIICKAFPDGGGVYSAARDQSRSLAVVGALLLVADLTVTAALSAWSALSYFGVPAVYVMGTTILAIVVVGVVNFFGPKHSGSLAVALAIPTVIVVVAIVGLSLPYLTTAHLEPSHDSFRHNWAAFVGVILALSGVEAIANITGVMKLDPGSTPEHPQVGQTSRRAIAVVAVEVVLGTALLGWAMLSLPFDAQMIEGRKEDMMRFLGEHYGAVLMGPSFGHLMGIFIGTVVGLLLLSAVNTAIVALIGLVYMMARDGEMPRTFARLNSHGVPWAPLIIAVVLPVVVVAVTSSFEVLADLYAIGVVGAIAVNLGACTFNAKLSMRGYERLVMGMTCLVLVAIELTIAYTKNKALFFACCILSAGMGLRMWAQKRAGLETVTLHKDVVAALSPAVAERLQLKLEEGQKIMVAARGLTPVLRYALEEARLRKGTLYVLFVKELAVSMPAAPLERTTPKWQDDPQASAIMYGMFDLAKQHEVNLVPLYAVSEDPAGSILDLSALLGIDILMLGASRRKFFTQLIRGNVIESVAKDLPENIQLVIHG